MADFEWETSKENILPLKSGRSTVDIKTAFEGNNIKKEAERNAFEQALHENTLSEDPLDLWRRYLKWTQQSFPQGTPDYLHLLERCTKHFQSSERYQNDVRLIKIWISYADMCDDPTEVFNFMRANSIGSEVALFYEAWALSLESRKMFTEADQAYEEGLKRMAQPIDRLHKRQKEFQHRVLKRIQEMKAKKSQRTSSSLNKENGGSGGCRQALNSLTKKQASGSKRPTAAFKPSKPLSSIALNGNKNSGFTVFADSSSNAPPKDGPSGFSIFQDSTESDNDATPAETAGPWKNLAPETEKRKENVGIATKWEGPLPSQAKKKGRVVSPGGGVAKFEVFMDTSSQNPLHTSVEAEFSINPDLPLKRSSEDSQADRVEACTAPTAAQPQEKSMMSPVHHWVEEDGEAISFEERRWNSVKPATFAVPDLPSRDLVAPRGRGPTQSPLDAPDSGSVLPSPTICTKKAMQDIDELFCSPWTSKRANLVDTPSPSPSHSARAMSLFHATPTSTQHNLSYSISAGSNLPGPSPIQQVPDTTPRMNSQARLEVTLMDSLCVSDTTEDKSSEATSQDQIAEETPDADCNMISEGDSTSKGYIFNPCGLSVISEGSREETLSEGMTISSSDRSSDNIVVVPAPFDSDSKAQVMPTVHKVLNADSSVFLLMDDQLSLAPSQKSVGAVVEIGDTEYQILKMIGQGGFATVFMVEDVDSNDLETSWALKVQTPSDGLWEYYITQQLQKRIVSHWKNSFVAPTCLACYQNSSFLITQFGEHGTLQDVLNCYLDKGVKMDETLVIYYTIEILKVVEEMHSVGIIHGDIKPDNILVRDDNADVDDWSNWTPGWETDSGWRSKGIQLIDFGRGIDVRMYKGEKSDVAFEGDSATSAFRCTEMLEGRPWNFHADYYCVCAVVYCLLHGKYMEVKRNLEGEVVPMEKFRRYWNVDLWEAMFKRMLNVRSCNQDDLPDLAAVRLSFEEYLESDPIKSKSLKVLLCKQNIMMFERNS